MEDNNKRKRYKIVLLGDNYIGTTCLIRRYIYNEYDPSKYWNHNEFFEKKLYQKMEKKYLFNFGIFTIQKYIHHLIDFS